MLNTDSSIQVPLYTILIVGFIALGLIILFISIIIVLIKKVKSLERIRYGFGGKTLFSILLLGALLIALPFAMYSVQQTTELRRIAEAQKEVYIDIQSREIEEGEYSVYFMAIPLIEGEVWGEYDYVVEWSITGPVAFKKFEKERNIHNPSYFKKVLPRGMYHLDLVIKSKDFTLLETKDFLIGTE